jgi:hypothetical protein
MAEPLTTTDLKRRCNAWPPDLVRAAVSRALYDAAANREEADALCRLIAIWLTEPEMSEPPPLHRSVVQRIWRELSGQLQ